MALSHNFDRDLLKIISDLGTTMTFDSEEYACIVSTISQSKDGAMSGYTEDISLQVVARVSILPAVLPEVGDKLTINSKVYRIIRTEIDETGAGYSMYCSDGSQ